MNEAATEAPIPLYQYWDTGNPPEEVAVLLRSWAADPAVRQVLFNHATARAFLAARVPDPLPARVLAAFDACANPAMQADLFRAAALYAEGGLYSDADLGSQGRAADLMAPAPQGLLVALVDGPNTDLVLARAPRLPLLAAWIERAVDNIERRLSNNVAQVTGPQLLMSLLDGPEGRALFEGWLIETRISAVRSISMPIEMAYKRAADDWRNQIGKGGASIFTSATPAGETGRLELPRWAPPLPRLGAGAVLAFTYDEGGAGLHPSWRADPLFRLAEYDRAAAETWLAHHCGDPVRRAFALAPDAARRAQVFALAHLREAGGLYLRPGFVNLGGWDWLLAAAPVGLWTGRLESFVIPDIANAARPRLPLVVRGLEILGQRIRGEADARNPKIDALPPEMGAVMKFLGTRRGEQALAIWKGWRIEDRHSLGRFMAPA